MNCTPAVYVGDLLLQSSRFGKYFTMASALSESPQSFKRAFDMFDHEQTGEINFVDFPAAVRSLGFNLSQADEVLRATNKQEKDKINFDEFSNMMGKLETRRKEEAEESLREAFMKFDRDGNGYISPDELLYVVCNSGERLSREEAEELISMFDKNADGQLSWEEFVEFFKCDKEAPEDTIPEEDSTEEDAIPC
ncbi:uncharacterized protein [Montipora foliosa]|uniref:uncharacterized protein n=1 Tax=Montipora foliosa TaxID=591990 RepID=UPI0035F193B5